MGHQSQMTARIEKALVETVEVIGETVRICKCLDFIADLKKSDAQQREHEEREK